MKNQYNKRTIWKSLISAMVFCLFIIMAVGSGDILTLIFGFEDGGMRKLDDGRIEVWYQYDEDGEDIVYYTGNRDKYARWHGPVEVKHEENSYFKSEIIYHTYGNYVHGVKDGKFKTVYRSGTIEYECYKMGKLIECEKAAHLPGSELSTFDVLANEYLELLYVLYAYNFTEEYIKAFTDTLDLLIAGSEFAPEEFDEYYYDAIDTLEQTPYDSILNINSLVAGLKGMELLKNDELRLAVIDRYRSEEGKTFEIVNSVYPNYLLTLEQNEVNENDFEVFCHDLDSTLDSYGSLDTEDTFFVDSVDDRLFRAIVSVYEAEESASTVLISLKNPVSITDNITYYKLYREAKSNFNVLLPELSSSDVAEIILYLMFMKTPEGDLLKLAAEETWLTNKGVIVIPTVTTGFVENISPVSVALEGYIHKDGGGEVFTRGIAVATYYDPTTSDFTISSGAGVGSFSVTIEGLTEGTTYYARSYARNSAGTAYGNCISFVPSAAAVGIQYTNQIDNTLTIYPNPASAITTFSFDMQEAQHIQLSVIDLKGRVVSESDHAITTKGENKVQLDLSRLPDGIYVCLLKNNSTILAKRKLIISH